MGGSLHAQITVRVPRDFKVRLKALAKIERRGESDLVRLILEDGLIAREKAARVGNNWTKIGPNHGK